MRSWRVVTAAVACLVLLGGFGTQAADAGTTSLAKRGKALLKASSASESWTSGAYLGTNDPAAYKAFGDWRGRKVDVAVTYASRDTWNDVSNPAWLLNSYKNSGMDVSMAVAMVPLADDSATMAGCARGDYRNQWLAFGRNVAGTGMAARTIVRLGWEFNGDWNKWSANDPDQFGECWRQIVSAVRVNAPQIRWDWTVNRGKGQSVLDARNAWPGNDYVDIVGVDSFDWWPAVDSATNWMHQLDDQFGLAFWLSYAVEHGKKFSVPEWGLIGVGGNGGNAGGGDNDYYIRVMEWFFSKAAPYLAYESYFNDAQGTLGSIHAPAQNPQAATAYQAAYTP